ncbi:hypothetical protein GCM10027064_22620 [Microbacterium petrolearium]|jgi:cell division protein FtsB
MTGSAPPSRVRRRTPRAASARDWLGGLRVSGFTVIMLGLVVLGAFVLVPTVGTFVEQRQKIAALEEAVQLTADEIADLEAEQERWQDPAYITTQARERLYYERPGEVVYIIDNDLDESELPRDEEPVSDEVEEARADWMGQLLRSVVASGLTQTAVGPEG